VDKSISDLVASLVDIPPDSLSGNAKHRCCLFLFKLLQIDEFQYCYLFRKQRYNLLLFIRAALRCITSR
jgi:hypothetical protein